MVLTLDEALILCLWIQGTETRKDNVVSGLQTVNIRSLAVTHCAAASSILGSSPTNACLCQIRGSEIVWPPCWLPRGVTPEEPPRMRVKHASKGSTLVLKPRADTTRSSKQGYQWPHKMDWCRPKFWKKKDLLLSVFHTHVQNETWTKLRKVNWWLFKSDLSLLWVFLHQSFVSRYRWSGFSLRMT